MSMRIGIPLVGGIHWHGGITYLEALISAFRTLPQKEQPSLYLLIDKSHARDLSVYSYFLEALDGFIVIGYSGALPEEISKKSSLIGTFKEVANHVDLIFPVNSDCLPGFAYVSWLPDFQHRHLPQLFSKADFALREEAINFVLAAANSIVVSSESVKKDLVHYYSSFCGQVKVVPFFSRFDPSCFEQNPHIAASRYHLPERYLICCNQFWEHKNHDTLFRSLALTKHPVQLVCTGAHQDYRNKKWLSQLTSLIAELGIEDRISLLGFIPRADQIQLMRQSLAIVQPSLFEGWSTVMEDARGLGKMVIASDLEIHREQAVPNAYYFDPKSPLELAALLDLAYIEQQQGHHADKEKRAQEDVKRRQIESAKNLLDLFENTLQIQHAKRMTSIGDRAIYVEMNQTSRIVQLNQNVIEKEAEIQNMEAEIQIKEAEIQSKEHAIQNMEAEIQSKENALAQMTQSCVEKEAVIQNLLTRMNALHTSEPIQNIRRKLLSRFDSIAKRGKHKLRTIFAYRLGILIQHDPKPLDLPAHYSRPIQLKHYPKISVVTPSFKQAEFIERTINSVLDQKYPDLEFFVQDGGSPDGTIEILNRYADKLLGWDSRKDNGQSQAINLGFAKTSGEIMAWLNSDDILLPGSLAYVADFFNRHPNVDVVYGHRILINENDQQIGRWMLPAHDNEVLSWADYIPQETLFWRRRIWDKAGGRIDESFRFAMDWDLLIRFREAGARFTRLPRFLGGFRIHLQQKTSAEISVIGVQEMTRIRERILGRIPSDRAIYNAVLPYMRKHIVTDLWWRIRHKLRMPS